MARHPLSPAGAARAIPIQERRVADYRAAINLIPNPAWSNPTYRSLQRKLERAELRLARLYQVSSTYKEGLSHSAGL